MSMPELTVISNVRKEVDYLNPNAVLGEAIFSQRWWLGPHTKLGRHLHEGMNEVIGLVRGSARMRVWLGGLIEPRTHLLLPGNVIFVPTGSVHAIVNHGDEEAMFTATGIKTREGGQTIRFE